MMTNTLDTTMTVKKRPGNLLLYLEQKQIKYNTTLNEDTDSVNVPIVTVPYFD